VDYGDLIVQVVVSQYSSTSLRDALIESIALTANNSAAGSNCHDLRYTEDVPLKRDPSGWDSPLVNLRRWLGLKIGIGDVEKREGIRPFHGTTTHCDTGHFVAANYLPPSFWVDKNWGEMDYIYMEWRFDGHGGNRPWYCDFLEALTIEMQELPLPPEARMVERDANAFCAAELPDTAI